jgi:hypothetical protein
MEPAVLLVVARYAMTHGWADKIQSSDHPERVFFSAIPSILADWRADHVRRTHLL